MPARLIKGFPSRPVALATVASLIGAALLGLFGVEDSGMRLGQQALGGPIAPPPATVAASPASPPAVIVKPPAPARPVVTVEPLAPPVQLASAASLLEHFASSGYTLKAVRSAGEAVPRVFLPRLPRDLPALEPPDMRKTVFIKMLLPLILVENERIRANRAQALKVRERLEEGLPVPNRQLEWLGELATRYGVDDGDLDELMRRIDAVPPSLALAQAALETGWGTSRVAQHGHAMFGQMIFRGAGTTLVSSVREFEHLGAAVAAYAINLNTHRAYADFRSQRAAMRRAGRTPDGYELAAYLTRYSERKDDYVRDVRNLIRFNDLTPFDRARLDE